MSDRRSTADEQTRSRFFALLREYRNDSSQFSIVYKRRGNTRKISPEIEKNILRQLRLEKQLIENPNIPLQTYNYSYIRDLLWQKYRQKVSVPTIIKRAKENDFFLRRPKRKAHDREVLTNYIGELIQHDSSHHKWSPPTPLVRKLIKAIRRSFRDLLMALPADEYPKTRTYIENFSRQAILFFDYWLDHKRWISFTTNAIESTFSRVVNRIKRVGRRWSENGLINWLAIAFRKIRRFRRGGRERPRETSGILSRRKTLS